MFENVLVLCVKCHGALFIVVCTKKRPTVSNQKTYVRPSFLVLCKSLEYRLNAKNELRQSRVSRVHNKQPTGCDAQLAAQLYKQDHESPKASTGDIRLIGVHQ